MKILTFTTLYPNRVTPSHGIFVEHRLKHLITTGDIEARVVAPVPWFPSTNPRFGRYADFARVPFRENRNGVEIIHPRYPVLPKIGMTIAPTLMATWVIRCLKSILKEGFEFDLIDAHFLFPDGVAAVLAGRLLGKPVVLTARGTDVHTYPRYVLVRRMILWAIQNAQAVVTVCEALRQELLKLGVGEERVSTLRNGVDLDLFQPGDRQEARRRLRFDRTTLLCVGSLREVKGQSLLIRALDELPDTDLVLVGDGEEKSNLQTLASSRGVLSRVRFIPAIDQHLLPDYYCAADALVLASSREGWPNVLLESMARGTPVVATATWGIPEVVTERAAGVLFSERSPHSLAMAVTELFEDYPTAQETRKYAERFDWSQTSLGL